MGAEDHRATGRGQQRVADKIADCVAQGERLARATNAQRDLRWRVAAFYVGDLNALVSARLRGF